MDDIELTKKIKNLQWDIDLSSGTCKSELVRYEIKNKKDHIDLQMYWISPDIPASTAIIKKIQRSAVEALLAFNKKENPSA